MLRKGRLKRSRSSRSATSSPPAARRGAGSPSTRLRAHPALLRLLHQQATATSRSTASSAPGATRRGPTELAPGRDRRPPPATEPQRRPAPVRPRRLLYIGTGDGGGAGDRTTTRGTRTASSGSCCGSTRGKGRGYRSPRSNPYVGGRGRRDLLVWTPQPVALLLRRHARRRSATSARSAGRRSTTRSGRRARRQLRLGPLRARALRGHRPSPRRATGRRFSTTRRSAGLAVIGGYVVRDRTLPGSGRYLYSDYCAGEIRWLDPYANPGATDRRWAPRRPRARSGRARREDLRGLARGPVYRMVER